MRSRTEEIDKSPASIFDYKVSRPYCSSSRSPTVSYLGETIITKSSARALLVAAVLFQNGRSVIRISWKSARHEALRLLLTLQQTVSQMCACSWQQHSTTQPGLRAVQIAVYNLLIGLLS